jgi:hypothetical protein
MLLLELAAPVVLPTAVPEVPKLLADMDQLLLLLLNNHSSDHPLGTAGLLEELSLPANEMTTELLDVVVIPLAV